MTTHTTALALAAIFTLTPAFASAQEAEVAQEAELSPPPSIALNLQPIVGFAYSSIGGATWAGGAGLIAEFSLGDHWGLVTEAHARKTWGYGGEATRIGADLGLRYHLDPGLDGWFFGSQAGAWQSYREQGDFLLAGGAVNAGYRWLWDSGLNITARLGPGYAVGLVGADGHAVYIDSELSIGWAF